MFHSHPQLHLPDTYKFVKRRRYIYINKKAFIIIIYSIWRCILFNCIKVPSYSQIHWKDPETTFRSRQRELCQGQQKFWAVSEGITSLVDSKLVCVPLCLCPSLNFHCAGQFWSDLGLSPDDFYLPNSDSPSWHENSIRIMVYHEEQLWPHRPILTHMKDSFVPICNTCVQTLQSVTEL